AAPADRMGGAAARDGRQRPGARLPVRLDECGRLRLLPGGRRPRALAAATTHLEPHGGCRAQRLRALLRRDQLRRLARPVRDVRAHARGPGELLCGGAAVLPERAGGRSVLDGGALRAARPGARVGRLAPDAVAERRLVGRPPCVLSPCCPPPPRSSAPWT